MDFFNLIKEIRDVLYPEIVDKHGQVQNLSISITTLPAGDGATANYDASTAILHIGVPIGDQGIQGIQGIQGVQGVQGVKGDTGSQGMTGATGAQGIQGVKGDTGLTGGQGLQGERGDQGLQGIQGLQGDTGEKGESYSVDASGTTAERSLYSANLKGYSFLDIQQQLLFIKTSDQDGDHWSTGAPFGKGDDGREVEMQIASGVLQSRYVGETVWNTLYDFNSVIAHAAATDNPHNVTKTHLSLENVDNTSDADKPVSTLQLAEINTRSKILNASMTITVGSGGDFTDLEAALYEAGKYKVVGNFDCYVKILAGTEITTLVSLIRLDLTGWKLISEDAVVVFSDATGGMVLNKCRGLLYSIMMDRGGLDSTGLRALSSELHIDAAKGVKNVVGNYGISADNCTIAMSGAHFKDNKYGGYFKGCYGSIAYSYFTNCTIGLMLDGSFLDCNTIRAYGYINYGVKVLHGGNCNLYYARTRQDGTDANNNGTMDLSTDINVTEAGFVSATNAYGGTNLTPNTLTPSGVILK